MSRLSDMDAVLTNIVRLTPLLAGVDRCAILLWDVREEAFAPAQSYGLAPELRETFEAMMFRAGTMPALDVMRVKEEPVLASASDGLLIPADLAKTFNLREVLLLPLLAQGGLLGAMMVDYAGKAHTFEQRMVNMLVGIANQAAMVIHSAQLVEAQQEEAYVSAVLLQVAEVVSASQDLSETLAAVVRIVPMLAGVDVCAIFLRDRAGPPRLAPQSAGTTGGVFLPCQQHGLKGEAQAGFMGLCLGEDAAVVRGLLAGEQFVVLPGMPGRPSAPSAPSGSRSMPGASEDRRDGTAQGNGDLDHQSALLLSFFEPAGPALWPCRWQSWVRLSGSWPSTTAIHSTTFPSGGSASWPVSPRRHRSL